MSESQTQKKKNKAKKKPERSDIPNSIDKDSKRPVTLESDSNKNISQVSNSKTLDNFIEAVIDHKNQVSDESTGKKKKKSKKKSKDLTKETVLENSNSESLLNYSEKGIHLVNHPEISVTIAESVVAKNDEIKTVVEKIPQVDEKKPNNINGHPVNTGTDHADNTNTAKKKKKKKKKNNSDNLPPAPTPSNEDSVPTPTYTKVLTSDNTCVLVVNNENFSTSAKPIEKAENIKNKIPDSTVNFSMPSEKPLGSVLLTKNFTPDTNMQFSNTVSIFPVLSNGNAATPVQATNMPILLKENLNVEAQVNGTSQEIVDESKPTKSQLKAERRAKQEAQRAAKLLAKSNANANSAPPAPENKNVTSKEKPLSKEKSSKEGAIKVEATNDNSVAKLSNEKESLHKVKLFSHLPQSKKFDINTKIHPAMLEIGFQYYKGTICGSNARCIALLEAFVEVIRDYTPHPDRNFCRDLESNIQSYVTFLNNCRPLSVSMMNAIRFLKHEINQVPSDMEITEIKDRLCDFIFNFVKVEIVLAKEAIANRASYKIINGDVILVLGFSSVIRDVLCKAFERKTIFKVVVVDTKPKLEGLKMLKHLVKQGLQCSYISINAVSYIMKEVTKFIIGAHGILANGCVMSRLGNKQIALVASTYGVPVFVCCETYKFCERVLTDSFVHNELGDPKDIITASQTFNDSLKNWHDLPLLQPLNLLYDLTTPNLIAEIVTEKGTLPCTSVPVFLRMRFAGMTQ